MVEKLSWVVMEEQRVGVPSFILCSQTDLTPPLSPVLFPHLLSVGGERLDALSCGLLLTKLPVMSMEGIFLGITLPLSPPQRPIQGKSERF